VANAVLTVAPQSAAAPAPFIDRYLAYLLARASHRVSSGFHAQLAERGVSASTWRVVASLQAGPLAVGELAERVLLAQPTLSKALDKLELEQLVRRARDPSNRRSVTITLTEQGQQLCTELVPLANHYEAVCFSHMSDAERGQLVALLQKAIV
jgi:DNA-binding MarR family transcriptional regulator